MSARVAFLLAMALPAALSACVWPATSVDPARAAFATNPRAADLALLEYMLEQHFAGEEAQSLTTCATVVAGQRGAVPFDAGLSEETEKALMARFARLAPFPRCQWDGSRYVDTADGGPAVVFVVDDLQCERVDQCTAWAGGVTTPQRSVSRWYTLKFVRGVWRVGPAQNEIILT